MIPTIINILKPHPTSTKPNLQKICQETKIKYDATDTRSQLTTKIASFADESVSNEAIIRKLVNEINAEGKKNKTQTSVSTENNGETMEIDLSQSLSQPPQSITESEYDSQTPLFDNTQDQSQNTQSTTQIPMSQLPLFDETQQISDKTTDMHIPGQKRRFVNTELTEGESVDKKLKTNDVSEVTFQEFVHNTNAERAETRRLIERLSTSLEEETKNRIDLELRIDELTETVKQCPCKCKSVHSNATPQSVTTPPSNSTMPPTTTTAASTSSATPSPVSSILPDTITTSNNNNAPFERTRPLLSEEVKNKTNNSSCNNNNNDDHPQEAQGKTSHRPNPKLLLITDSNGKYLNPRQLKPGSHGNRKDRYTIDQAIESIPEIPKPEEVEDIVFNMGLNDLRRGLTPEAIQTKYLDMQMAYNDRFPNARQHITAIPPS